MMVFAHLMNLFQTWLDNINNELNSIGILLNSTN